MCEIFWQTIRDPLLVFSGGLITYLINRSNQRYQIKQEKTQQEFQIKNEAQETRKKAYEDFLKVMSPIIAKIGMANDNLIIPMGEFDCVFYAIDKLMIYASSEIVEKLNKLLSNAQNAEISLQIIKDIKVIMRKEIGIEDRLARPY